MWKKPHSDGERVYSVSLYTPSHTSRAVLIHRMVIGFGSTRSWPPLSPSLSVLSHLPFLFFGLFHPLLFPSLLPSFFARLSLLPFLFQSAEVAQLLSKRRRCVSGSFLYHIRSHVCNNIISARVNLYNYVNISTWIGGLCPPLWYIYIYMRAPMCWNIWRKQGAKFCEVSQVFLKQKILGRWSKNKAISCTWPCALEHLNK